MDTKTNQRRYNLDWLRVLAILTIFLYHTIRFFNSESWHIKNATSYFVMDVFETILTNWIMALIFAISGASMFYALNKGSASKIVKDKIFRLVVPLVVMGMGVFGVWQFYLDYLSHGEFNGSFFTFIPFYFQPGVFAWAGIHLWYLEMLFIFCLIFLPLFLWLKRSSGHPMLVRIGDLVALPGALYLLALPTILCLIFTSANSFLGETEWGGGSILSHATFFLSGFIIISHKRLQESIQRYRVLSLTLVVVLLVTIFILMMVFGEPSTGTLLYLLGRTLWGFWSWCWVLAIFGFGMKYLNFNKPVLSYANEAVLPFYILHHPVLLTVGYFVVQWTIPDVIKFFVIDAISFVIIMGLYEFLVRRFNLMRFLFGMKLVVRTSVTHIQEPQVV
jgi:glucan biosynthesis protein C